MRCALLACALALLVVQGRGEEAEGQSGGLFGGRLQGVIEPRLAANAIRYHDLEKHVEKLKARIEEAKHVDPQRFIHDLEARLTEIEGTHCEDNEFQCGDNGQECISDLFVCDGNKDCHNGHDEHKDVCDTSAISAGKTFSGITHWTDCLVLPDHTSHLTIVATKRAHFFSSRIGVHAIATSVIKGKDGEEKMQHYEVKGGYNFAHRRLYLIPAKDYGQANMALECVFDHGDWERLDCHIQTEASEHVCAESHLSLQHHDYDDHHEEDDDDDDDHSNHHAHHDDDEHDDDDDDDDDHDDHHKHHRRHRGHHNDH